ncbi:MAG: TraR/DksA C4-type zinc finger protein [Acidobacteria bacterium]|nr:TraR/DksA C4-type zinc finger protein [Acidobacteriota bacterium]
MGTVVNARELVRYKRLLLEKQQELSSARAGTEVLVPGAGDPGGDFIDQANADFEAELQIRLHQTDGPLLRAIQEALARIKDGRFGTCQGCGHRISKARLGAVPWTRRCRECKEREAA